MENSNINNNDYHNDECLDGHSKDFKNENLNHNKDESNSSKHVDSVELPNESKHNLQNEKNVDESLGDSTNGSDIGHTSTESNKEDSSLGDKPIEDKVTVNDGVDDDIMKLFYAEIDTIEDFSKNEVEYSNTANVKMDPKALCLRLTSQKFSSPYQVLQLNYNATEEQIKQRYYKMSLLIHPDKCKIDKAPQAFQVLKDAYNSIKEVDIREKYKEIYEDAKKIIYKKHKLKLDITPLEIFTLGLNVDLKDIEKEIESECVKLLNKQKERREYAENCIKSNIQYQQNLHNNLMELEKEKLYQQLQWDNTRDMRVNSWKSFQSKNSNLINKHKIINTKKEEDKQIINNKNSINLIQNMRINKRKKIQSSLNFSNPQGTPN